MDDGQARSAIDARTVRSYVKRFAFVLAIILFVAFTIHAALADGAPTILVLEPNLTDYAASQVPVALVINGTVTGCSVIEDGRETSLTRINETLYNGTLTLTDGLHVLSFSCTDGIFVVGENRTIIVDTTAPSMALAPSGTLLDRAVILRATTNELATCRFDTVAAPYAALREQLGAPNSLVHETALSLEEGTYIYHVSCADVRGNAASTATTQFTVRHAPTAIVSVEGENPHAAGTYKVTLTVSEPLVGMPTLTLVNQGGGSQSISLNEAEPARYVGYLIVDDAAGEQVGSFSFRGVDRDGLEGSRITRAELFIVDTVKPQQVKTFHAVNASGAVSLSWYYDLESDIVFNLYRSAEQGVDYTDFLASTTGNSFTDAAVQDAVTYYYRIAPVDQAGNVGPLSAEEYASPAAALYDEQEVGALLTPVLQVALDNRLRMNDERLLTAKRAMQDLQAVSDPAIVSIIAEFSLLEDAQRAITTFTAAQQRLESLRTIQLTREEFDARVSEIQRTADEAFATLPVAVSISDATSFDELTEDVAVSSALETVLSGTTTSAQEREQWLTDALALRDRARIETTVTHISIAFADGLSQPYTLVRKSVVLDQPLENGLLIETIPKSVAARAADIRFLGEQPVVLEQDPIVQYSFSPLSSQEISYAVKGRFDETEVRKSRLVVLERQQESATAESSSAADGSTGDHTALTGSALAATTDGFSGQSILFLLGIIIVAGLLVYYVKLQFSSDEAVSSVGLSPSAFPAGVPFTSGGGFMPGIPVALTPASHVPIQQTIIVRREEPLTGLLLKAHTLIDENRYLDARYFYKAALQKYDQEQFPSPATREAFRQELTTLHAKLSLFSTVMRAHDAVALDDQAQLENALTSMRDLAVEIGDQETPFIARSKTEYDYLFIQLARLRERVASEEQ